jgi:hypothetical protein
LGAVADGTHSKAGKAEACGQKIADIRFVVDDKDAGAVSHDPSICALAEALLRVVGVASYSGPVRRDMTSITDMMD